ncbi:hypothetical protein D3C86_1925830 [compost metagenome]
MFSDEIGRGGNRHPCRGESKGVPLNLVVDRICCVQNFDVRIQKRGTIVENDVLSDLIVVAAATALGDLGLQHYARRAGECPGILDIVILDEIVHGIIAIDPV